MISTLYAYDLEALKRSLANGADVEERDPQGLTALALAATMRPEFVRALLEAGADPNARGSHGETGLSAMGWSRESAESGLAIVDLLLEAGADPNGSAFGWTALASAARAGDAEIVGRLLAYDADSNYPTERGRHPLNLAREGGHHAVVEALETAGALTPAPEAADLETAVAWNYPEAVDRGLSKSSGKDLSDLLLLAIERYGNPAVVEKLLDAGADPNTIEGEGGVQSTALWLAVVQDREAVAVLLLRRGADPRLLGHAPELMSEAAGRGQVEALRALIESGLSADESDDEGGTPLMTAALRGAEQAVHFLLFHGANPNARTLTVSDEHSGGLTPLIAACKRREPSVSILEALLAAGADVNGADDYGTTPLMWAARQGNVRVLRWLIDRGADVNAAQKGWMTAFDEAIAGRNPEAVHELRKHGVKSRRYPEPSFPVGEGQGA